MEIRIIIPKCNQTLYFAANELSKYIKKIDNSVDTAILSVDISQIPFSNGIVLNFCSDSKIPEVANQTLDDSYYIEISNCKGVILGVNARSVLLGVYRYLKELGVAFLRPGQYGEIIPSISLEKHELIRVAEKSSYRHRGVCIEGASSFTHVMDLIDWLPKIGMNSYFNQFMSPSTFFERWYSHKSNEHMTSQPVTPQEIEGMVSTHIQEIKKRGMLYHAVGHGWTCNPFGIEGSGWDIKQYDISDETAELFAQVDGKRELWGGIPLNTNLCYSNPKAFNGIVNAIVSYCEEHDEVDYVHFWLADGMNNHCECQNCKDVIPSDYYIMMLNSIDEKLTQKGLNTRIVFLVYVDLLWEPLKAKIHNPERFTLMFAPITRTYTTPLYNGQADLDINLSPYERNKLVMPKSAAENVARLSKWQKQFSGDSFDYDYHFFWDNNYDLGGYESARILYEDMKNLDKLKLNGMSSCQVQRVSFPTGLAMYAMASALWDKTHDFEEVAKEYYDKFFGLYSDEMQEYFKALSILFDPSYMRTEKEIINKESADKFAKIPALVNEMLPKLHIRLKNSKSDFERTTWQSLIVHADLAILLSEAIYQKAIGNQKQAIEHWSLAADYLKCMENIIHPLFDVEYFLDVYGKAIERQVVPDIN